MPEKSSSPSSKKKSTFYVNSIIGLRIEDNNNGELRIKMDGDTKEYILHTIPFKNCRTQKYKEKLFGKYSNVFFEDNNALLEEIAKLIIGW